jgi:hypothetical protein
MKKVTGYAPVGKGTPYIPKFIQTESGLFDKDGKFAEGLSCPIPEISIDEFEWIGINHLGVVETFKKSEEKEWVAKVAQKALESIPDPKKDPELTLKYIQNLTRFVGVDFAQLMQKIKPQAN